jgi:hypothetical protein
VLPEVLPEHPTLSVIEVIEYTVVAVGFTTRETMLEDVVW